MAGRQRLWATSSGTGPPLVLLHPGGVDQRALDPLVRELEPHYRLHRPEQRGHGHTPDIDGPLTFAAMADDTIGFIESLDEVAPTAPVHLAGHSDGAIVALHVALARPDLVRSLVFASGVFHRDGWLPGVLDGDPPEFFRDGYGEVSPDGVGHWEAVVEKLRILHATEPTLTTDALQTLTVPTLVLLGDDDEVRFDHATALYDALPDAELAVVPRSTHGVVVEKPELVARLIRDFHSPGKSDGFAPLRRR